MRLFRILALALAVVLLGIGVRPLTWVAMADITEVLGNGMGSYEWGYGGQSDWSDDAGTGGMLEHQASTTVGPGKVVTEVESTGGAVKVLPSLKATENNEACEGQPMRSFQPMTPFCGPAVTRARELESENAFRE